MRAFCSPLCGVAWLLQWRVLLSSSDCVVVAVEVPVACPVVVVVVVVVVSLVVVVVSFIVVVWSRPLWLHEGGPGGRGCLPSPSEGCGGLASW